MMDKPFRNLLLNKSVGEVEMFLKSMRKFYTIDIINFFSMNVSYAYKCVRFIKEKEKLTEDYIPQSIMKKYLEIRA